MLNINNNKFHYLNHECVLFISIASKIVFVTDKSYFSETKVEINKPFREEALDTFVQLRIKTLTVIL